MGQEDREKTRVRTEPAAPRPAPNEAGRRGGCGSRREVASGCFRTSAVMAIRPPTPFPGSDPFSGLRWVNYENNYDKVRVIDVNRSHVTGWSPSYRSLFGSPYTLMEFR